MSEKEINDVIEENLPKEIDGFARRIGVFNNFSTIIYSKDGSFLGNHLTGNITRDNENTPLEYFAKSVLFEVTGKSLEESYHKIKDKLDLNLKVKADFSKNVMFGFNPNFEYSDGTHKHFLKLFEIYLVLDLNSDSQFFCVVTINPSFDSLYILPIIKDLKKQIGEHKFFKLSGEDFDYEDFDLPRTVHLYSYDFDQKKDEIRMLFRKHGWNVKFKDKYEFEKQANLKQERIILCEGNNYKILNNLKIPNVVFSEEHNSISIFQNIKTRQRYCLRDKDFLLDEEIKRLKQVFPKYYILDYYCIENYLYHPENIDELLLLGFSKQEYTENIISSKNNCLFDIISNFKLIRKGYKELTETHIKAVKDADSILINELKSNEFEVFYKHFDMKSYKKDFLERYKLNDFKLANTNWFKSRIIKIITRDS